MKITSLKSAKLESGVNSTADMENQAHVSSHPMASASCVIQASQSRPEINRKGSVWRIECNSGKRFDNTDLNKLLNSLSEELGSDQFVARISRSGSLIVEVCSMRQADLLLCIKKLGEFDVKIEPHRVKNSSSGTIYAKNLADQSEENILQALKNQNVIRVERLQLVNSLSTPSPIFVLIFSQADAPSHVIVQTQRFQVRSRIPVPIRCRNCQSLGHSSSKCQRITICSKCGKKGHSFTSCRSRFVKCINCKGPHAASDNYCPVYLQEKEVNRLVNYERIFLNEARALARRSYPIARARQVLTSPSV